MAFELATVVADPLAVTAADADVDGAEPGDELDGTTVRGVLLLTVSLSSLVATDVPPVSVPLEHETTPIDRAVITIAAIKRDLVTRQPYRGSCGISGRVGRPRRRLAVRR